MAGNPALSISNAPQKAESRLLWPISILGDTSEGSNRSWARQSRFPRAIRIGESVNFSGRYL